MARAAMDMGQLGLLTATLGQKLQQTPRSVLHPLPGPRHARPVLHQLNMSSRICSKAILERLPKCPETGKPSCLCKGMETFVSNRD